MLMIEMLLCFVRFVVTQIDYLFSAREKQHCCFNHLGTPENAEDDERIEVLRF